MNLDELFDRLICLVYPPRCVLCGELVEYDDMWCGRCEWTRAEPVPARQRQGLRDAAAAVEYSGNARLAVWRIKRRADKRTLLFFAEKMRDILQDRWGDVRFDVLVPVPASESRRKERGFNQAEELAKVLGHMANLPVASDALTRSESSRTQHDLTARQRWDNALESYRAGAADAVANRTVLLVDDVHTTGATLSACATRLLEMGAASVYAVTATKTHTHTPGAARPEGASLVVALLADPMDQAEDTLAAEALKQDLDDALNRLLAREEAGGFFLIPECGPAVWAGELLLQKKKADPSLTLELAVPYTDLAASWPQRAAKQDLSRYRELLGSPAIKKSYPPDRDLRPDSYARCVRYILERSHHLLALWSGKPGPVADAIASAQALQLPCTVLEADRYLELETTRQNKSDA